MRYAQKLSVGFVSLLSVASSACSSTPPVNGVAAGTGAVPAPAVGGAAGAPKAGTGGTTLPPVSGTTGGVAGKPPVVTAGSGAAGVGPVAGGGAAGTTPVAGGGAGGAATGAGFKVCGKPAGAGMCRNNAPGVYAMRLDTDVWFFDENAKATSAPPLFSPGRGKLSIWFKTTISDICEDGSAGVAVNRTCGSVMPPIYADASSGVAQIVFPPELWDKPGMPEYTTVGSTSSFDVGATLKIAATPGLLGIKLADINGAFPTAAQTGTFKCEGGMGETCFTDPDGDMIPGVTVDIQTTGTPPDAPFPRTIAGQKWVYAPVPTDALAALSHEGATKLALGLRTNAGGEGVIGADCASGKGVADVGDFESRIIDCVKGTTACTLMESQFVDTVTPTFRVLKKDEVPGPDYKFVDGTGSVPKAQNDALDRSKSVGSTATVVRLGDIGTTFTCAQVRDALVGK